MYKIYIDSADRKEKSVQLLEDDKVVSEKKGDIDIVGAIRDLLKESKLNVKDIDEFSSNLGPGSFTGLKMGVTIANVLNWALGKKKITELDLPNYGREPNITPPKKFSL